MAGADAAAAKAVAAGELAPGELAPLPCLFTGARELAKHIKSTVSPGLVASTQGPNLMVALGLPPSVSQAASLSATIEHSGQCTALRVLVAPAADATPQTLEGMFEPTPTGSTASEYLASGNFAGLLHPPPASAPLAAAAAAAYTAPEGYTAHATQPVAYKTRPTLPDLPATSTADAGEPPLDEHWRQVSRDRWAWPWRARRARAPSTLDTPHPSPKSSASLGPHQCGGPHRRPSTGGRAVLDAVAPLPHSLTSLTHSQLASRLASISFTGGARRGNARRADWLGRRRRARGRVAHPPPANQPRHQRRHQRGCPRHRERRARVGLRRRRRHRATRPPPRRARALRDLGTLRLLDWGCRQACSHGAGQCRRRLLRARLRAGTPPSEPHQANPT